MPVVVRLKNGTDQELVLAHKCSWSAASGCESGPRWLVCTNERGDVLASYEEADVNGFYVVPRKKTPRFRFPRILNRSAV